MKSALKKELYTLDRDQLIRLILDLYATRKEAKAYFDFFLEPDVDKLYEKYRKAIEKELDRSKRYRSTARISRVRASVKEFASYDPGPETVVNLMIYTIKAALIIQSRRESSKTILAGLCKVCNECLNYADKHEIYSYAYKLLEDVLNGQSGYIGYVNMVRRSIEWPIIDPDSRK